MLNRAFFTAVTCTGLAGSVALGACGGDTATLEVTRHGDLSVTSYLAPGNGAGSDSTRSAAFTAAMPSCAGTTVAAGQGTCTVLPCFEPTPGDAAHPPNAGDVTISGAQLTTAVLSPTSAGYASLVVNGVAWKGGGETITMEWAHAPGDVAGEGGSVTLATPVYVDLSSRSAFAVATKTLRRALPLALTWTTLGTAAATDQLVVDLSSPNATGGLSTRVLCQFPASAQAASLPAAALEALSPGMGKYEVHSKQYASRSVPGGDGGAWTLGFNVIAQARASDGAAVGDVLYE